MDDGHCIVLEPEVDRLIWAWSPHVAAALGWPDMASIKSWLATKGLWPEDAAKPPRPKEALEECLREKRKPRSSALYRAICGKVSVPNCTDPAVRELCGVLCRWFPQDHSAS
ncbi:MAG: hypothetical protein HQL40_06395 [Alphaproteobacteria bacterium]|nr:hypothetical protein [Alphaproteobacteria bacterium]